MIFSRQMGKARILTASAGAGKTYQLAYKYVSDVIERPWFYRHILAVTFTNKATEEMKSRILGEINDLARGEQTSYLKDLLRDFPQFDARDIRDRAAEARSLILHDYSRFTVLTIDKFFQRIIRAFLKELNLDLNYNIEIETDTVLDRSVDQLIESISTDETLKKWLIGYARERIEENAKWDIRDSISKLGKELFKEIDEQIGATASKEEIEARMKRAMERNYAIEQKMVGIAHQAQAVMASHGLIASDFKGGTNSFVRYFDNVAANGFVEPTASARKATMADEAWYAAKSPRKADILAVVGELRSMLAELCQIYDKNIRRYNATRLFRETFRSYALLKDLYSKIADDCEKEGTVLLSQTKNILSEFIEKNDAPFIYEKVGNRYEHFMIDEFQDTSHKEWSNFLPLLRNSLAQSEHHPVLIVGDVKQSIYRWRGGDWQILARGVAEGLEEENIISKSLVENRRSLPLIVQFNNAMIGRAVENDSATIQAILDQAVAEDRLSSEDAHHLSSLMANAYRGHSQTPLRKCENDGYISITRYGLDRDDERNTTPPVIECVERVLSAGYHPSDIMILTRNNKDGKLISTELLDYTGSEAARFRFDVITQDALTISYDPVTGFIIACMRLAVNPTDDLSRLTMNKYLAERGMERALDAELSDEESEFFSQMRATSPEVAFEQIVMHYGLDKQAEAVAYIQALHEQIVAFCTNRVADIPLLLRWWDERGSDTNLSSQENNQAIEVSTIHKSKGLERKVVIIPYCNWSMEPRAGGGGTLVWADSADSEFEGLGPIPLRYKNEMANSDFSAEYYNERVNNHIDNVNLLYVALTRAKEQLHIMYPVSCDKNSVGALIDSTIVVNDNEAELPHNEAESNRAIKGRVEVADNCQRIEFGEFMPPDPYGFDRKKDRAERLILTDYPTRDTSSQLRLRLPSQRYFEEGDEVRLSPRNFGVAMHKSFEQATSVEDIYKAIENMHRNSLLSDKESDHLRELIEKAMQNPTIAEWFNGEWQEVRNENNIIVPDGKMYRPDRVMISDERTIVVDYKFGMEQDSAHTRQIARYCKLLREMGYRNVEGHIWYIVLNKVESITA